MPSLGHYIVEQRGVLETRRLYEPLIEWLVARGTNKGTCFATSSREGGKRSNEGSVETYSASVYNLTLRIEIQIELWV